MKRLLVIFLILSASLHLMKAQERSQPADSLVRLMSAQSAEMTEEHGRKIRKVYGPARFLHNGTYLLCDTAYWDVDVRYIQAYGHVKILQDETVLSSERLDYLIDDNLAKFRGTLVQLQDKDGNTLRTRNLDYNTRDSVAVFRGGGAMRDKEGQLIESNTGTYDSRAKVFEFEQNVNMFTDSVFVKTSKLTYLSGENKAYFEGGVDIWRNADMLSAKSGLYDRSADIFHFFTDVHGMTDRQEGWADTLAFNRLSQDFEFHGNVQLTDEQRRVWSFGENVWYVDSLDRLTMSVDATVIAEIEEGEEGRKTLDTLYMAADSISRRAMRKCDISGGEISAAAKRLKDIEIDPVTAYRKKADDAAKKEAEDKKKQMDEEMGKKPAGGPGSGEGPRMGEAPAAPQNETGAAPEGETEKTEAAPEGETEKTEAAPEGEEQTSETGQEAEESAEAGSGEEPATEGNESATEGGEGENPPSEEGGEGSEGSEGGEAAEEQVPEAPKDTTIVSFLEAIGKVRVFKSDIQARCDSLCYNELDSLARLYENPMVWSEGNRQYSSDSLFLQTENNKLRKASFLANAFITIQEDSLLFDQIRGAEMIAYFDTTTTLQRFDALGGATAIFYLEENSALATVNKVESKMLSAYFQNGQIERIYYFDKPKNDAYPTVQLKRDDRRMKGFKWDPDLRPSCKEDVTPYSIRPSERKAYEARPEAAFVQTNIYFPGYIKQVKASIAARELARQRSRQLRDSLALDLPDSLQASRRLSALKPDSLALGDLRDSLGIGAIADSLAMMPPVDKMERDSLSMTKVTLAPLLGENPDSLSQVVPVPADAGDVVAGTKEEVTLSEAEQKKLAAERKRAERDSLSAARKARKEARWAELDARDAEKAAAKAAKKQEHYRKMVAKKLAIRDKNAAREQKYYEKYLEKYRKQKEARDAKAASKASDNREARPKKVRLRKEKSDSE